MPSKQIPPGWGENRGKLPPGWKREETKLYEEAAPEEPSAAVPVPEEPERIADAQTPAPAPAVPEPVEEEPPKPEEPKPVEPEPEESEPEESEPEEPKLVEPTPEEPEPEEPKPEKPYPEQPKKKAPRSPRKKRPVWVWGLCGAAVVCLGIFVGLHLNGGDDDKPVLPTDGAIAENMPTPTLVLGTEPTTVPTVEPTPEESDEPAMPAEPSAEPSAAPDSEGTPTAESSIPPTNSTSEPPIASPTDSGENISTLEQAVKKARSRLNSEFGYSRSKLIEFLETYDGFTYEEAVYAADHCGADWMEQAVKSAQSRLNGEYGYSQNSLIKHLEEYDGFTHEEAVYGVDHSGADWKEQAVKMVQSWLKLTPENEYSQSWVIKQLETYQGFTHEEAVYAADHSGADWNEQALKAATFCLENDYGYGYSYNGLIRSLEESYEFTHEEAIYAADHCGADWNEEAMKTAKYRLEYIEQQSNGQLKRSRKEIIEYLEDSWSFTHEEAVYGVDHCGADWKEQALKYVQSLYYWYPRNNLISILEQHGFTNEEAVYAADHCGWYGNE